jgi:iron(III) transport system substrate-binding protein
MKKTAILLLALLMAPAAVAQTAAGKTTWDEVLAAAKREGKIVVIGSPDPVVRNKIVPAFAARYGIQVSYIAGGCGELTGKVRVERSSGIHSVDVFLCGNDTSINVLYREKMIDPIRPLMIQPEAVDGSKWKLGKLTFVDPEDIYVLRLFRTLIDVLYINEDYVKAEEMRSAQDLLNPKWKGKISSEDPTVSGAGISAAARFYVDLGPDFVKKLYIDQKPFINRDRRLLSDSLARGTHPICLNCRPDEVRDLVKAGFKLTDVYQLDGVSARVRPGPFLVTLANKAPNPNAAQVFLNWMAGKEALEIYSRDYGETTLRTDVDESFLDPRMIPKAGGSYRDEADYTWVSTGRLEINDKVRALLKDRRD